MEQRFEEGIIVGIIEHSDEYIVSTGRGLITTRNLKRREPGSQWCAAAVMLILPQHGLASQHCGVFSSFKGYQPYILM